MFIYSLKAMGLFRKDLTGSSKSSAVISTQAFAPEESI